MFRTLTLTLLTWRIWCASTSASKWQMGFNSAFKGLNNPRYILSVKPGGPQSRSGSFRTHYEIVFHEEDKTIKPLAPDQKNLSL